MGRRNHARPRELGSVAFGAYALSCLLVFGLLLLVLMCPETSTQAASDAARAAKPAAATPVASAEDDNVDEDKSDRVYVWSASRNQSRVTLRGAVPSEEDRQTVLGMVKAHFPDLSVEEKVKVIDAGIQREQWLGAVSFGLQQLAHMRKGKVKLSSTKMLVMGEASSAAEYTDIKKALAGPLPAGLAIKDDDVRPPVADPFVFTADLGVNALSLAGSVPSEDARKSVRDLSRQLFARPGLNDRLEVASGAPKKFDEAVAAALRALSRLETGKIALSGIAVSIEGVAPDQGTAVAVSYQLRRDLPKMFSTSESIKWKEAMAPQDMADNVLPRIKAFTRTTGDWPTGALPPLIGQH